MLFACLSGSMDVLEVLGSSDAILPLLATAMTTSAAVPAAAPHPLDEPQSGTEDQQSNSQPSTSDQLADDTELAGHVAGQQAAAPGEQGAGESSPARAQASCSGTEPGQGPQQTAPDADTGPAGPRQTSPSAGPGSAGQGRDAPGKTPPWLQPIAPLEGDAPQTAPDADPDPAGQRQTSPSAAPGSAGQGKDAPDETPPWLQPIAPLAGRRPSGAASGVAGSTGPLAEAKMHQLQQRQEQRHEQKQVMPAGTALRTMRQTPKTAGEIEQGQGQIDAPLEQQEGGLMSLTAPNEDLPFEVAQEARQARQAVHDPHTQGQDAPSPGHDQQAVRDPHAQGQDAPSPGHDQQQTPAPNGHGPGQDAPSTGCDQQHQEQAARPSGHSQRAQGQQPLGSGQSQQRADSPTQSTGPNVPSWAARDCSQVQQPGGKGTDTDTGPDGVVHSGVVEDECAVSSRERAQHHLQLAGPLPWQLPENSELTRRPDKQS